jgi:hypothetical protein
VGPSVAETPALPTSPVAPVPAQRPTSNIQTPERTFETIQEAEAFIDRVLRNLRLERTDFINFENIKNRLIIQYLQNRNSGIRSIERNIDSLIHVILAEEAVMYARENNDQFMNLFIAHLPVFRDKPLDERQIAIIRFAGVQNYESWLQEKYNRQTSQQLPIQSPEPPRVRRLGRQFNPLNS